MCLPNVGRTGTYHSTRTHIDATSRRILVKETILGRLENVITAICDLAYVGNVTTYAGNYISGIHLHGAYTSKQPRKKKKYLFHVMFF